MRVTIGLLLVVALTACEQDQLESVAPLYDSAPVEVRDIEVNVEAAGVIEPEITVEVKSKASGEILAIHADTGDVVEEGFLLVEVDKRTPSNRLAEAEASLVAARARRAIAETQMERSKTLFETGTLTETDYEQSQLEYANSEAQVIGSEVALENARIAMDDTDVRAPITGTIILKNVEQGTVISSPTQDVSGGTILMQMADLTAVQVRTLVDETDIGKIRPGMTTRVTVAAYPNQPFEGEVLKIEPQAIVEQNVTMFAVLIRLENRGGLLKPGMNAEVDIQIANRSAASVVPTMALRADSDIPVAAMMLGLEETELRTALGSEFGAEDASGADTAAVGEIDMDLVRELMTRRRNGETLSAAEQAQLEAMMQARQQANGGAIGTGGMIGAAGGGTTAFAGGGMGDFEFGGGGGRQGGRSSGSVLEYQFGGDYWVVAMRDGVPVPMTVRTGVTDLRYSEIVEGLEPEDHVLLLPSSSLFEQQEMLQQFISDRFGSSTPFSQQSGGGGGTGRFR